MKNLLALFVFALFTITFSFAQETEMVLEKKSSNSFPLTFEDYNKKNLEVEWKRYIKSFGGKVKKNKETKEFFAENVIIKNISDKPIDIYATIFKSKKTSILTLWFSVDGVFFIPTAKATSIDNILNEFSTLAISNEAARKIASGTTTKEDKTGTIRNPVTSRTVNTNMEKGCQHATAPVED